MNDVPLSGADAAAFGLTETQASELSDWIQARVGHVLGASGRGGSGVFVEAPDGRTALLTARHVLIPAVLSGEASVVVPHGPDKGRCAKVVALRAARRADAALLYLETDVSVARITLREWDPRMMPQVLRGQGVVAAGAPGEWKSTPNLDERSIELTRVLLFWTALTETNANGQLQCDVDESVRALPRSFKGMSGGPMFDLQRHLIGINKSEHRDVLDGNLFATRRDAWEDLFHPFEPPPNAPTDYIIQKALHTFRVRPRGSAGDTGTIDAAFLCEFLWSPSEPDYRYGELGRVTGMQLALGQGPENYIINIESTFHLPSNHDEVSRREALEEEVRFLLDSMGYVIAR